VTLKTGLGSVKVIKNDTIRSGTYDCVTDRQTDIKMDGQTPDDSKDRAKRRDIENPFVAVL